MRILLLTITALLALGYANNSSQPPNGREIREVKVMPEREPQIKIVPRNKTIRYRYYPRDNYTQTNNYYNNAPIHTRPRYVTRPRFVNYPNNWR